MHEMLSILQHLKGISRGLVVSQIDSGMAFDVTVFQRSKRANLDQ
jgi:hypothetical protein